MLTVVEPAVEDIVEGADRNRRLGRQGDALVGDVTAWYGWCAGIDLPPLAARRHHVDRWIAEQLEHPQPGTGRPAAAATVTRRLSCLAGLYEYAVVDARPARSVPGVAGETPAGVRPVPDQLL